jgi:hypothetical protein
MATRQTLPSFLAWRIAKIPQFIPEPCKESEPKEEWITYHKKQECLKPNLVPGWGYRRHTHRKVTRLLILRADNCPQGMRGVPVVRSGVSLFCFLLSHERSTLVSTKSEPYRTGYPYAVPQGVRPQPLLGINSFQHHPLTTPLDANRPIAPIAPILPSLLFAPIFHVPLATLIPLCLRKLTQTALLPHPLMILPTPLAQPPRTLSRPPPARKGICYLCPCWFVSILFFVSHTSTI